MADDTSTIEQVRESLRLQQVYNVFSKYSLDILLDRGVLGTFRRRMQTWIFRPSEPLVPLSIPQKVRLMLQELGPTYVKVGQIVSSRSESLPPEWQEELIKLQSDVPPFPYEQVVETIVKELGDEPEAIFAEFETEPFAAASTAQVHRATLDGGQRVVVKVQRPGIKAQVISDLGIMKNGARVVERRAKWAREANLVAVLTEFGDSVVSELDYHGEAYNARRITANMASIPEVHIPIVYSQLTTSRVLTMEMVSGVKITNNEAIDAAGLDREALAEATVRSLIKQIVIDGFFHGDPHPGNVLVDLDTGIINYIDLGMVGELTVSQRMNLIQLLMVVQRHDSRGLAEVMASLSTPYREVDLKHYYRNFDRRVGRYLDPDSGANFSQAVGAAFDLLQENGMRLDTELTIALKSIIQLEAITRSLFPGGGLVEMAERVATQLALQTVTKDRVADELRKQVTTTAREVIGRVPTLQEATMRWLNQYEKGRFEVHLDTSDLSRELGRLRRLGFQVVVALLLVGMLIASSLAASVSLASGLMAGTLPQIAAWGYAISMVLAILAVIGYVWRLWRRKDND